MPKRSPSLHIPIKIVGLRLASIRQFFEDNRKANYYSNYYICEQQARRRLEQREQVDEQYPDKKQLNHMRQMGLIYAFKNLEA